MIPNGWRSFPLADLADQIMVGIASAATHAYRDSGVLMIRNTNIKAGRIELDDVLFIDPIYERAHKNKRLRAGDVITVRTGYPGISAVVPASLEGAQCFTSLITRPKRNLLDSEYLALYINSDLGMTFISASQAGGAQKNVNAGSLAQMPILLPPLDEQRKIVEIVSHWAQAVSTIESLIAAKQRRKQALEQRLLTGKMRLPGFKGAWMNARIGSFLTESRTPGSNGSTAKKLTVKLYGKGVVARNDRLIGSDNTKYYRRSSGQFIYGKLDFLNGAFGIVPNEFDGYESTLDLPAFDFHTGVDPYFFLQFVGQLRFYEQFSGSAEGGRKARRIQVDELLNASIALPEPKEQVAISRVLRAASREIELLEAKKAAIDKQKSGLMDVLLTGNKRIKA